MPWMKGKALSARSAFRVPNSKFKVQSLALHPGKHFVGASDTVFHECSAIFQSSETTGVPRGLPFVVGGAPGRRDLQCQKTKSLAQRWVLP